MRVISGVARGRKLYVPPGNEIRPATDRLKEALFNILLTVEDERVLDLYAGTGSLAIEALSRGACHATLVESHARGIAAIERNLAICGFEDRATVLRRDAVHGAGSLECQQHGPYDLVLIDPPYIVGSDELAGLAGALARPNLLALGARIAFERRTGDPPPPLPPGFDWVRQRRYGQTTLHLAEKAAT